MCTHLPKIVSLWNWWFPSSTMLLKIQFYTFSTHPTIAMFRKVNEVTYFRDAFKGNFSSRSREEPGTAAQSRLLLGRFVRRCIPECPWVRPLLIQQLWLSTLSGRLPGCVVGLVSLLWFLNGTWAPIHDADQTVSSPRPTLKNKKCNSADEGTCQ